MPSTYIVDCNAVPWKRSASEGVGFACQVLLSGDDGGPEALRFRFDACPSVYAHMHLTPQFQLLLGGAMDFPRGVKHLEALGLHYTDHNTPYGPFATSEGHEMLVLHPAPGGIVSMMSSDARRRINLHGRLHAGSVADVEWNPLLEIEGAEFKRLMPAGFGPDAIVVRAPAHVALPMPPAEFGRYEVVLRGSVIIANRELGSPGLRYVRGDESAEALVTGSDGASVAFLTFDQDALEGGIAEQPLGAEAAAAMARAL